MPATDRTKAIEKELGEPLAKFITRSFRAGDAIKDIARELEIDPMVVREYLSQYDGHVHICICPVCDVSFCLMRMNSHKEGRCIITCLEFKDRNDQ